VQPLYPNAEYPSPPRPLKTAQRGPQKGTLMWVPFYARRIPLYARTDKLIGVIFVSPMEQISYPRPITASMLEVINQNSIKIAPSAVAICLIDEIAQDIVVTSPCFLTAEGSNRFDTSLKKKNVCGVYLQLESARGLIFRGFRSAGQGCLRLLAWLLGCSSNYLGNQILFGRSIRRY
jgi:hypothetical protein